MVGNNRGMLFSAFQTPPTRRSHDIGCRSGAAPPRSPSRELVGGCANPEVRNQAIRLLGLHPLRAADALQLAAALVWADRRPRGHPFVCLDAGLREAAHAEGFSVLPK